MYYLINVKGIGKSALNSPQKYVLCMWLPSVVPGFMRVECNLKVVEKSLIESFVYDIV